MTQMTQIHEYVQKIPASHSEMQGFFYVLFKYQMYEKLRSNSLRLHTLAKVQQMVFSKKREY